LENLSTQVLKDFLGASIEKFYVKETEVVNPVLTGIFGSIIIKFSGSWNIVERKYQIVKNE